MPGRTHTNHRFSVNGMEKSPEIASGHNTSYFRELDARTGRWWSVDPVWQPWQSPYCTFDNNPIYYADPHGDDTGGGTPDPKPSEKELKKLRKKGWEYEDGVGLYQVGATTTVVAKRIYSVKFKYVASDNYTSERAKIERYENYKKSNPHYYLPDANRQEANHRSWEVIQREQELARLRREIDASRNPFYLYGHVTYEVFWILHDGLQAGSAYSKGDYGTGNTYTAGMLLPFVAGHTLRHAEVGSGVLLPKSKPFALVDDAVGGTIVEIENSTYLTVVKGNKTFHISPDRVKEFIKNPLNPNARWGDQINFKQYGVPNGSQIILGKGKGHKRTPTQGELDMYNKYFNK